jgi:prepilin-type N-terminal cleavage/methylation domain-containing protein
MELQLKKMGRHVRAGFTMVELLIVITVILILASMMLAIRPTNPEGIGNGQRMMADMIRIAKVQATMNRAALPKINGWSSNWAPANYRYRLLIKCDPANPDSHLREMVIAIGCTGIGATPLLYTWFSPEPPVRLPPGVYFVPPNIAAINGMASSPNPGVVMPTNLTLSGTSAATRLSKIPGLADVVGLVTGANEYCTPGSATQAPMMLYRPIFSPALMSSATAGVAVYYNQAGVHTVVGGGNYWYYVELGPDGSNNHTGKVVLVLAEGMNVGTQTILTSADKFAAILVRRSGDVTLTTDTVDLESTGTSTLLK